MDWTSLNSAAPPSVAAGAAKPEPAALAADAAAAAAAGGYAPQPAPQAQDQQQHRPEAGAGPAQPDLQQRPSQAREPKSSVEVICNDLTGTFHVATMQITLPDGTSMSPTEFERQAGKAASKKWKASIRVHKVWTGAELCTHA